MLRRFIVLALVLFAVGGRSVDASSSSFGGLVLRIRDVTGKPVPYADVILIGKQTIRSVADGAGEIRFDGLPSGVIAIRVWKSGFEEREISLKIVSDVDADALVYLLPLGSALKQIAVTSVQYHSHVSTADFTNDERRSIAFDPLGALQFAPQVSVGPNGAIGVDGHTPTQTDVSIAGVSIAPPGVALNSAFLGSDIFSALSVGARRVTTLLGGQFMWIPPIRRSSG